MPERIAELTEGQRGRMASWAQAWVTRGLATGPVDRAAGLAAHPLFNQQDLRDAGPAAGADGVSQPVRGSVARELSHTLRWPVRGAVSAAISQPVHQAVMTGVHRVVVRGLIEGIHSPVHRAVTDTVGGAAAGTLAGTIRAAALAAVGAATGEVPRRALDPLFVPVDRSVRARPARHRSPW